MTDAPKARPERWRLAGWPGGVSPPVYAYTLTNRTRQRGVGSLVTGHSLIQFRVE